MDKAPAPAVMTLSKTGAALTGLPHHVTRAVSGQVTPPELSRKRQQSEKSAPTRMTVDGDSSTANAEVKLGGRKAQLERELVALANALTGTTQLSGCQPFASCYGGHQFGNWAGQLGDGRVATLGEIRVAGDRDTEVAGLWNGRQIEVR